MPCGIVLFSAAFALRSQDSLTTNRRRGGMDPSLRFGILQNKQLSKRECILEQLNAGFLVGLKIDADDVKPERDIFTHLAQELAGYMAEVALLFQVHGSFGRFYLARGARLDFNEAERAAVPAHKIKLAAAARTAVVARHNHIAHTPQIEVGFVFTAASGVEMLRAGWFCGQEFGSAIERENSEACESAGHRIRREWSRMNTNVNRMNPDSRIFASFAASYFASFSTIPMHSSSTSSAMSACSSVTMSGGTTRIDVSPAPRKSRPRSNARSTMRSRSSCAMALVFLSFTISMPIIRPMPRTSPTMGCFSTHVLSRLRMWLPTTSALRMPSRSRTSMVASAAAMQTGLPPKVEACEPGTQSMTSARAMVIPNGIPDAVPFAIVTISASTSNCWIAHHLPVRPAPDCTSSATRRMRWRSQSLRNCLRNSRGAGTYPPSP